MIKAYGVSHLMLMCSLVQDLPTRFRHDDCTVVRSCQRYRGTAIKRSITARLTKDWPFLGEGSLTNRFKFV